ncbi:phospholipase A [Paraburkholderia adhaesiva]|uniref:phospholipase A n=1 Tax=Paraburkholderia adhaesiva TaxID=2883244 RepID=UPI0027E51B21|nr:phospholipase A [Paraburkholderia adhaesiva]
MSVLRPPREARSDEPLAVTIIYSGEGPSGSSIDVPRTVTITLTNGEALPREVVLTREAGAPEHLQLGTGEIKAVSYSAAWPEWARGALRVDVPGVDVSPSVVLLTRVPGQAAVANAATPGQAPAAQATGTPEAPKTGNEALVAAMPPTPAPTHTNSLIPDLGTFLAGRLSMYEPTYFADGVDSHGNNIAKFQVSFKYRFILPKDPRSRGFFDNLYFAYTQTSLWDIREYSAPFRDTSYKPAMFYYLPDTGWKSNWFSKMGVMAGYEHESNGIAGPDSRGIDILFVKPIWDFGNVNAYHLTVAPKVYWYEHIAGENSNITDYRGYVDLLMTYGSPDGWQLAVTLRKGTKSHYGSVDAQFTYPLAKLFGSASGAYLWIGYFGGYGEDILDYNQHRSIARIGFSVSRW